MFQKNRFQKNRTLLKLLHRQDRPLACPKVEQILIISLKKSSVHTGNQVRAISLKNMNSSKVTSPYWCHTLERVHQGDILREIEVVLWVFKKEKEIDVKKRGLEYAIILTQECDLEQDVNNRINCKDHSDKFIDSILLIPAYPADKVREGNHIKGSKMQTFHSDPWRSLKDNHDYRYHYLKEFPDFQLPSLVADFKHYFTIPRDILYEAYMNKKHYVASLAELFRENLSIRFAQYLARIGLPDIIIAAPSVSTST
jgi:hypothetical protein